MNFFSLPAFCATCYGFHYEPHSSSASAQHADLTVMGAPRSRPKTNFDGTKLPMVVAPIAEHSMLRKLLFSSMSSTQK
jgi:hypothetical protein